MKNPVAGGKNSFPGDLPVKVGEGVATVFPGECSSEVQGEALLETIYDHGPVPVKPSLP